MTETKTEVVVFDLGNVLIEWARENLYDKIITDADRRATFLDEVYTLDANQALDAGTSLPELVDRLQAAHPDFASEIEHLRSRWVETLGDTIKGTVSLLRELHEIGEVRLIALSNWGKDTFAQIEDVYDFLELFEALVISGREGFTKPGEEIFQLMCERHGFAADTALFIDDSAANIETADRLGFKTHLFAEPDALRKDLATAGLI